MALEELAPFGADRGQSVVEGFVGIAHRLMIGVVPVGGIIHLGRLQGAIKGPVWCASTGRARWCLHHPTAACGRKLPRAALRATRTPQANV